MADELPQTELPEEETPAVRQPAKRRRRIFSWRTLLILGGVFLLGFLVLVASGIFAYRSGYVDRQLATRISQSFADIGLRTEYGGLKTTIAPLSLEYKDFTLYDAQTNEKLAKADRLNLKISIPDWLETQFRRTVKITATEIDGLEVWIRFDENGRSNFANLKSTPENPNLKIDFATAQLKLNSGLIHYGDLSRKLSGEARNVQTLIEPEDANAPDADRRYKFDFASKSSNFIYDDKQIEPVDIAARGIASTKGAEISELKLKTPFSDSVLSGTLENWEKIIYNLKIESTVDLQQTAETLKTGTALRGFGNLSGTVTGEAENYKIVADINSDAIQAANVYLKGFRGSADVNGTNETYEANAKAVAEMLNTGDFELDMLQLAGNIRGTGTDFKWLGELRAAAARAPNKTTIAGLILADAYAEYIDNKFGANVGRISAQNLKTDGADANGLEARNAKINSVNGDTNAQVSSLNAAGVTAQGAKLKGVTAGNVKLHNRGNATEVEIGNLTAQNVENKDAKLKGVTAGNAKINLRGNEINAKIAAAKVGEINAQGARIKNVAANNISILNRGNTTEIESANAEIGGVETSQAVLGSINVAGVRLKIVAGRIEGAGDSVNAGNVTLTKTRDNPNGGSLENVRLVRPVFVVEPAGRYRASMDLSLGGGVLGSLRVGAASAKVTATNEQVELKQLNAQVLDGQVNGEAVIALAKNRESSVNAEFSGVELSKAMALQGGKVLPIAGKASGRADLTFPATNFKLASGAVTADFQATAGSEKNGFVPLNGKLGVKAVRGLFNIDYANFQTEKSTFNAAGRFDLDGTDSDLQIALNSTDAKEIQRLISALGVAPQVDEQLASYNAQLAGNLTFSGNLRGNLENPTVEGKTSLEAVLVNGQNIGSIASNIRVSPAQIEITDGVLAQTNGGTARFNVTIPQPQNNNIAVSATLENIDVGKLLPAVPETYRNQIPAQLLDFQGAASGKIELTGLPNSINGIAELNSADGAVAGIKYDSFATRLKFENRLVTIEKFESRAGDAILSAAGTYSGESDLFDINLTGQNIAVAQLQPLFGDAKDIPELTGNVNFTARARGDGAGIANADLANLDVNFDGAGREITVNKQLFGDLSFTGRTRNKLFEADITAQIPNATPQIVRATLNFADEKLPLRLESNFEKTDLAPYIALFQSTENVTLGGTASGNILLSGNLSEKTADGKSRFTTANLKGTARFSEFTLQAQDVYLQAVEPIQLSFSSAAVVVENAKFSGADSNIVISGTKALTAAGNNNLAVDGKLNLRLLNSLSKNTFFNGAADVMIRLTGTNEATRLSGSASVNNAALSLLVSNRRLQFTEVQTRILFNSNQAQITYLRAKLGGGTITGNGGVLLENLTPQRYRLSIRGTNITAPLPRNIVTTGDADLELNGERRDGVYFSNLSGFINARRGEYTEDVDLADLINNRVEGSLSEGASNPAIGAVRFDIQIEGRDAFVVRNNIADLTASVSLRLTGDDENPIITGRITSTSGTLFYRNDRYDIQRAIIEFPPQRNASPVVNLQATSDISGYQVSVNLNGSIAESDALKVSLRSNPALPQADIVSLITTGSLANTGEGISTLAQTGIGTAASLLTDSLINNPLRKATDKLFGLNKFEIDPILSGKRVLSPGARLTVGRQINRNLSVTYSTNLSAERNQVLALEYRVSNRLSFVAQYEQNAGANVTQRDNFRFEVRFRRRF